MRDFQPINFVKWVEENRERLKPPVGNQLIYKGEDFLVMVVGGPNKRADFHINHTEEWYYQIEGDITVRVKEEDQFIDIPIKAGEMFLQPPSLPHSPQRPANSVGLVMEKVRPGLEDGFVWYCEKCANVLYEEYLYVEDIVGQLPGIFDRYAADPNNKICRYCQG